jgi:3-oxoacid CoA-transferase subunit B
MALSSVKQRMLQRVSAEIHAGMTVNLGIGLPTRVIDYVDYGMNVCLHAENGISGVGPGVEFDRADRNLIDAGGAYVSVQPGTAFFDSAVSFALVRSGRLDLTILGAFEVAANGDLANWMIAMELAQKARRVIVLMSHCDRQGRPKIVRECSLPLTASACVDRIYTDLAVIDVDQKGLTLREVAEGVTVSEVIEATGAPLTVAEKPLPTF